MTLADRKTVQTDAVMAGLAFKRLKDRKESRVAKLAEHAEWLERERDAALEALELICKTYGQWVGEPGPSLTDTVESARATLRAIEEGKR